MTPGRAAGEAGSEPAAVSPPVAVPRFSAWLRSVGWHPDPTDYERARWWDGTMWTARVRQGRVHIDRPELPDGFFPLAVAVRAALVGCGILAGGCAVVAVWGADVLRGWQENPTSVSQELGSRVDTAVIAAERLYGAGLLVTGVLFIVWLYRAYGCNRVDPFLLNHARGWTIGAWFVPFLNLWRPRALVRDLWRGARSGTALEQEDTLGWRLTLWWQLFVWSSILRAAVNQYVTSSVQAQGPGLLEDLVRAAWLRVGVWTLTVAAAAMAVVVVARVTEALRRTEYDDPMPAGA